MPRTAKRDALAIASAVAEAFPVPLEGGYETFADSVFHASSLSSGAVI